MKKNYLISIILVLLIILATKTDYYTKHVLGIDPSKNLHKIDTVTLDSNNLSTESIISNDTNSQLTNNKLINNDSTKLVKENVVSDSSSKNDTLVSDLLKSTIKDTLITLNHKGLKLVFSNKGAVIDSVILTKYKDDNENDLLLFSKNSIDNFSLNNYNFSKKYFKPIVNNNSVIFTYNDNNYNIKKIFTFDTLAYMINVNLSINSKKVFNKIYFLWDSPINVNDYYDKDYLAFFSYINNEIDNNTKSDKIQFTSTNPYWFGFRTKYFYGGYIFEGEKLQDGEISLKYDFNKKAKVFKGNFKTSYNLSNDYNNLQLNYKLSFVPIDRAILSSYPYNMKKVAKYTYGWIQWFSNIILYISIFLFGYLQNWGLVIIVVSIFLKLLLYPLNKKTIKSQQEMAKLQPQLKSLQAKYRNNPQLMQKETLALYKKHGVNPLGGCLPMLIQMPIFFGMYGVFRGAIQFRNAEFFGWITNLSQPEVIFQIGPLKVGLLVTLSTLSTFFTMRRQMTDPKQKSMPYFMSIFLFVIFSNMSAGLNLYWATFNLVQLVQELLTKKNK